MPGRETVRRWLRDMHEFRALYAVANHERPDSFFEEIAEIAEIRRQARDRRGRGRATDQTRRSRAGAEALLPPHQGGT